MVNVRVVLSLSGVWHEDEPLISLSILGLLSPTHSLFARESIPESFVMQYLERTGKVVQSQLRALKEVADLFDSMRRRDKELVNMVSPSILSMYIHICICTYVHMYVRM